MRCIIPSVLALAASVGAFAAEAPNVLLICVDDLKPTLGCYGDKVAITPNIDRMASQGVRFNKAYCNQAVCAPSRNNLMTGSRSTSLGIYDLGRNFRTAVPNAVTLSQYFMQHGYTAEAVGKIFHTGHGNHDDEASWSVPTHYEPVVEYLDPKSTAGGQLTREEAFFTNRELNRIGQLPKGTAWEIVDVPDEAYSDGRIANESVRRLEAAKASGKPFFLAVGFVKPHMPFTAPKKYWDLYKPGDFKLPAYRKDPVGAPQYARKDGAEINNYEPLPENGRLDTPEAIKMIHGYYACVSYIDAQIGKVLKALHELDLAKNTIVVLWGDHGWHLGDHGYWSKHTNYEHATRIPLIFVAPGVAKAGAATDQLAETVDIYPTVVQLAGLPEPEVPQPMDGISLVPVLKDPSVRIREFAYGCYPRGGRMGRVIRTDRYRLVEWKKPGAPRDTADIELYDYKTDPEERRNLASSQPKVVEELLEILYRQPEAK